MVMRPWATTYTVSNHYLQSATKHSIYIYTIYTVSTPSIGNEAVGRELLLELAGLLLTGSEEPRLSRILATTDLHILVSLNPDGFERSSEGSCDKNEEGRRNANNVATHNTKYFAEHKSSEGRHLFEQGKQTTCRDVKIYGSAFAGQ